LRIGLNLLYLIPGVVGGTETYAAGLLAGFRKSETNDEIVLFLNQESRHWNEDESRFQRVICPVNAENRMSRYFFEQFRLPRLLETERVDLVHSLGYVSPLKTSCPFVVTIPDLNYRAFGDRMPVIRRMTLATFVRLSGRRAARVITISEFAKREITGAFRLPTDRVVVTHLAPRLSTRTQSNDEAMPATLEQLGVRSPFVVGFSSLSPNKNIGRLLEAFQLARRRGSLTAELVLIGHSPSDLARSAGAGVRLIGYLDDPSLSQVLGRAQFLVFPSLYEGFGLPVLEAMEAGVPVACSNRASLPEVAGDAALLFDPESIEDMATAIACLATDAALRTELIEKGRRNVERFSWKQTAALTLDVYRQALAAALEKRERR
jgi:glycosyltransferase involved in cell wall biosynthesis